ncbi:hypothetical protein HDV05_008690 [Chytridiales sp. JEL 0842]|nr:hypothetical protein HDV05_008690 [Chytridiales sp. JEL 0842]
MWNVPSAVWVGSMTCYMSFMCALILSAIIKSHPNGEDSSTPTTPESNKISTQQAVVPVNYGTGMFREPELLETEHTAETLSKENDSSTEDGDIPQQDFSSNSRALNEPTDATPLLFKQVEDNGGIRLQIQSHQGRPWSIFTDILSFPFSFWLVCSICILLYGTVIPFNNIVSDFLMSKWYPNDTETAGLVMSIPDTLSAFLVPICGIIVDKYGHRATVLLFCAIVIACVHLTLGLTMLTPVIPLVFLGISYSLYGVALWPSIATIIQHEEQAIWERECQAHSQKLEAASQTLHNTISENDVPVSSSTTATNQSISFKPSRPTSNNSPPAAPLDASYTPPHPKLLGTAYGLSTAALNTGLTLIPLVSAQVRVVSGSFTYVEMFFVGLAITGGVFCWVLYVVDRANGSLLEKPEMGVDNGFGEGSTSEGSPDVQQDGVHNISWGGMDSGSTDEGGTPRAARSRQGSDLESLGCGLDSTALVKSKPPAEILDKGKKARKILYLEDSIASIADSEVGSEYEEAREVFEGGSAIEH